MSTDHFSCLRIAAISPELLGSADPSYVQTIVIYAGSAYRVTGWDGAALTLEPMTHAPGEEPA